jgi:ABC-2 type transport system permease protein
MAILKDLKAYPTLLRAYWALALEYRIRGLMWLLVGTYPLVMMAVWLNLARSGSIGGYTTNEFIGYYMAVVLVRRITYIWILDDYEERIRTGELSAFLLRPLEMPHMVLTNVIAIRAFNALLAGAVVGAIMLLIPGQQWMLTPFNIVAFLLTCALGFMFEFFLQSIVGSLAFWTTQVYRIFDMFFFVKSFLGGFVVPLALLPEGVQAIARVLPFQSSIALPAECLIGRATPERVLEGALVTLVWLVVMGIVFRWVWMRGLRSYGAVGA